MKNSLRVRLSFSHSLAGRTNSYKSKFTNPGKPALVWFILTVFLLSNLQVRGDTKLVDEKGEDDSVNVTEFNSENERKLGTDLKEIGTFASPYTDGLIDVGSGKKTNKYAVLQIEYKSALWRQKKFTDSKVSKIKGVTVLTTIDRFADVFVQSKNKYAFSQIENDPNMVRVEWASSVPIPPPLPLNRAKYSIKGVPEPIVRGGFTDFDGKKMTGKNVAIAVVDTGIDFTHPDFISYDADGNPTSRLLYFWNPALEYRAGRGEKGPFSYPNKTPIGTLFTRDQLTAELRAIKKGEAPSIPSTDQNGHGTACAGIAAGNGNADYGENGLKRPDVVGVAPDALIVGVRIDRDDSLGNSYLLNAICEWLDTVAGERSLVISSSFGSNYTGHDGQSVNERELNKRFENGEKQGRIMVASAGNEARTSIHAHVTLGDRNDAKLISWKAEKPPVDEPAKVKKAPVKEELVEIKLYLNISSEKNITIEPLVNNTVIDDKHLIWKLNKITNQVEATLKVRPGEGKIRLFNSAGIQTDVHLYFDTANLGTFSAGVDNNYLVQTPGSAESVITIGSSAWNNNFHSNGNPVELTSSCPIKENTYMPFELGSLSCYSSPGPTRDNRIKPDAVAPGEWFTASYAKDSPARKLPRRDSTKRYYSMNGTSAATPYTAGVVALLFEKHPGLTANQVKELFRNNLTKSDLKPFSGKVPNRHWGYGKLDLDAIKRIFKALDRGKFHELID
jgi:subtilisin family serine protease